MSLTQRAQAARARADATGDPGDEALATALEATESAECRRALQDLEVEASSAGIPTPAEAGFMSVLKIPPPAGN